MVLRVLAVRRVFHVPQDCRRDSEQVRSSRPLTERLLIGSTFISSLLKDVDPFASQKQESFRAVLPQLKSLARFVLELLNKPHKDTHMEFQHLLLVSVIYI